MPETQPPKVPISVIIITKNEAAHIKDCLKALSKFDDIWVVDSNSADSTLSIAKTCGARTQNFKWNGRYPKKRQYCLDTLPLKYERVFFVDADEHIPVALSEEIANLNWRCAGYFIKGRYIWNGKTLKHGLHNNKLALLDRRYIEFPIINDLNLPGMGEIEGHYQPTLKSGHQNKKIGQLKTPLLHNALENQQDWEARHRRYAQWEAGMKAKNAWPHDPNPNRQRLKMLFRALPARGALAFLHSYILKAGFLDGRPGFELARLRGRYYRMISNASKDWKNAGETPT